MSVCITYIHTTYVPTYVCTYLSMYIPTSLHKYIPTYLLPRYVLTSTYIASFLRPYVVYIHTTYVPTNLPTYLPTLLPNHSFISQSIHASTCSAIRMALNRTHPVMLQLNKGKTINHQLKHNTHSLSWAWLHVSDWINPSSGHDTKQTAGTM